ncbi:MAG TPA: hypothetical protein VKZ66_08145 [Pusillimonas sp.]|uniref:hypothetical protein n=1 Tax=unclassified Pusillimonas TaxID=2640016 RepID=UPI002633A139|nr:MULTISPECIES: hypothetical protein [unclassified Pusillimonas]HLU19914.1 hypothetical protein [Pusillimonas sp.]
MSHPSRPLSHARNSRSVKLRRAAVLIVLAAVLALGFIGHLTPGMKIQWENFMSMCGF